VLKLSLRLLRAIIAAIAGDHMSPTTYMPLAEAMCPDFMIKKWKTELKAEARSK